MDAVSEIEKIDVQAEKNLNPAFQEDYVGKDGLLYCGRCHTRKEYRINSALLRKEMIVSVKCQCEQGQWDREEAARALREKQNRIRRMKGTCIHDRALLDRTFEKDDGNLPQIGSAKKYVETWPERKANNDGLLLRGGVGTGKTFYAACIANALIEEGVSDKRTYPIKGFSRYW